MKIKIDRIIRREKDGKYGPYTQISVQSEGTWYTCPQKAWNQDWQDGDEVEVGGTTSREWQGKTYFSLVPPQGAAAAPANKNNEMVMQTLNDIVERLKRIEDALSGPDLPPTPEGY